MGCGSSAAFKLETRESSKTSPSPELEHESEIQVCWASGETESLPLHPGDTFDDLRRRFGARHKTSFTKVRFIQGTQRLAGRHSANALAGQSISVAISSVDVFDARICEPKKRSVFGRSWSSESNAFKTLAGGYKVGEQVKAKVNFTSPEGESVFEGDIGVVSGPGVPGFDDITVDFLSIENVGLKLKQVETFTPSEVSTEAGSDSGSSRS